MSIESEALLPDGLEEVLLPGNVEVLNIAHPDGGILYRGGDVPVPTFSRSFGVGELSETFMTTVVDDDQPDGVPHIFRWVIIVGDGETEVATTADYTVTSSGTYEVQVRDDNGHVGRQCAIVDLNNEISISIEAPPEFQVGEDVTFTLSAVDSDTLVGATFTFTNGAGTELLSAQNITDLIANGTVDVIISPTATDTYTFTATDARGHTASAMHTATLAVFIVSFNQPTGQFTWTAPDIQTQNVIPGDPMQQVTFSATASSTQSISGTATVSGLPSWATATSSLNNTGVGNTVTIRINGTPDDNAQDIDLVVSGLSLTSFVSKSITYDSTNVPAGSNEGGHSGANWSVGIGSGAIFQGQTGSATSRTRTWLVPSGVNASVTATLSLGTAPASQSGNTHFSNQRTILRSHYHGGTQEGTLFNSPSASGISGWTTSNGLTSASATGTLASGTTSTTMTFNSVGISGGVRNAFILLTSGNIPFGLGVYFWNNGDIGFGSQNVFGGVNVSQSVSASIGGPVTWSNQNTVFNTGSSTQEPGNPQQSQPAGSLNGQSGTISWSLSGFSISGAPVTYSG